ncbi:CHAT domain-containing protein [Streptomyces sp. NBC_01275]|uniref:CHAT domain-containing protein n=1 Tax=Streptomyces sp. NBC_01275 TaxID=2903807 RepID=UPI0022588FA6|nr:CHAT domain-containing protein [Streptomyces sp. NBC_01275]MCX4760611.1 CHAT domain-containing protein [Streptomyces sp. NBC_01275]
MAVRDQDDEAFDAVVRLVRDIHAEHMGEEAAERQVRSPRWALTEGAARSLVGFGYRHVREGIPSTGHLIARLMLAAADARWGRGTASPWWHAADLLVEAARLDLIDRPSGDRLRLACAVADEQIDTLRREANLDELAETMYAAGILRVHPHIGRSPLDGTGLLRERQVRGLLRGRFFTGGSGDGAAADTDSLGTESLDPDALDALPHPVDAALEALPYLYGAVGLSRGHLRARCRHAVNEALSILMNNPDAEGWTMDAWLANSRAAARSIDPALDPVNAIRLRRILAHYDGERPPATLGELLPVPLAELVRTRGERETWAVAEQALCLLRETGERDLLRELVAAVYAQLPDAESPEQLRELWHSHVHVLPGDTTACPGAEAGAGELQLALSALVAAPRPDTAAALHLAAHLAGLGGAQAACTLTDLLPDPLPDAGPEVTAAVRHLLATSHAAAGTACRQAGDLGEAIGRHATAARHYAILGLTDLGLRQTELMVECAVEGSADDTLRAAVLLRRRAAPWLNAGLHEESAFALVAAAQRLGADTREGPSSPFALLQLQSAAKALDFSRALARPGPRPPVQPLVDLRQRIDELESRLGEAVAPRLDDLAEDLEMLCYAGPQEHAPGNAEDELLGNLRRSFDRGLSRRLYALGPTDESSGRPDLDDVVAALPADTVLVSLWIGQQPSRMEPAGPDGQPAAALQLMTITREGVRDQRILPFGGMPAAVIRMSRDGYRHSLHPFGYEVASLRSVVRTDPLHRAVARGAEEELDCGRLFGRLTDVLTSLYDEGKRHLCFWAHGPFHFLPFPLLHLDGRPLADDWTVTTVPSLVCVTGPEEDRPRAGEGLVSLGASLGGAPWGLQPEPVLDEHATAVAEFAGGAALVGPAATPASLLARAQGARYVHVAAHGAHSQDASWFQCLYLNPPEAGEGPENSAEGENRRAGRQEASKDGRLFGHDVLAADLRGVDLVTLSACESGLGRFDLADNPRGLPAAFLLAGARAVVGCLWPVRAEAATYFFGELHRHLAGHHDTLRAFRHAQTVTRERFPQYRDWGAFAYHGGWSRPEEGNA